MNKKGFTVVELIVTFAFVMIIAVGLMNLVNSYRERAQNEVTRRDMNLYKNEILMAIQNDIYSYLIDKIELLDPGADPSDSLYLPEEYDRGLLLTFKISFDATGTKTKKLLIRTKGGASNDNGSGDANYSTISVIKYGDREFVAPDQFTSFMSDTMLDSTSDETNSYNFYKVTIKIYNEDINEYFNLRFAALSS